MGDRPIAAPYSQRPNRRFGRLADDLCFEHSRLRKESREFNAGRHPLARLTGRRDDQQDVVPGCGVA
jgi:hypothetical protein